MSDNISEVDPLVILPILKQIPLFSNLDENLHREIIQHIVLMYYPTNYTIFKKGDAGDALYIVKSGGVSVFQESTSELTKDPEIARIGTGGFFGEMALVSAEPRNASVKTIQESEVFILSKEDFETLLQSNTELATQISATVVSRINENNQ
jgi:CRP-like cAMP-binding protein